MPYSDENCPLCLIKYDREKCILKDSIDNSDIASSCKHYFCGDCLRKVYAKLRREFAKNIHYKMRCPFCREDWTHWLFTHYTPDDEWDEDGSIVLAKIGDNVIRLGRM